MLRKAQGKFIIPNEFELGKAERVFDIPKGMIDQQVVLKKGQALHKIATALLMDFYAPASVAQLFAKVFESEQFHPESSPHRIQELVRRLRNKLKVAKIPLEIVNLERGYKLELSNLDGLAIRMTAERSVGIELPAIIEKHFGSSLFSLRELMSVAGLPHTTLYRQIKDCVELGTIISTGSAKNTRYHLAASVLKKAVSN
jgi:hypothetical protein